VADRYDAGMRLGEQVAKDMIAVRIGPDFRNAVVGAPSYFERRPGPRRPHDLTDHNCINLRLPSSGGLWTWPFAKGGRELRVRTEGQLVFNTVPANGQHGRGRSGACIPAGRCRAGSRGSRPARSRSDRPVCAGVRLPPLYPSRRQATPAFALLVDALRYRGTQSSRETLILQINQNSAASVQGQTLRSQSSPTAQFVRC
jgi:hypothetical protein